MSLVIVRDRRDCFVEGGGELQYVPVVPCVVETLLAQRVAQFVHEA